VESHTEAKLTEFLAQLKDYSIFRSKIIYFIPSKPSASPEKQSLINVKAFNQEFRSN
jgi:hypothetical protein